MLFLCKACNVKFEAEGEKQEWLDATFGPCSKIVAACPSCGVAADEYRAPKQSANAPSHGHAPACGACCGGCHH
ncbi:MAG: hypothetical protein JW783_06300 [Bacteroidales bacterium]|nr:hypothetical protein [Bacteroidales bacterium]MBN2749463.1 hypothetical protein [Bacteroidales bacterium]MDX9853969.1 hypothetical protein [Tenuifilaceae bacterium]